TLRPFGALGPFGTLGAFGPLRPLLTAGAPRPVVALRSLSARRPARPGRPRDRTLVQHAADHVGDVLRARDEGTVGAVVDDGVALTRALRILHALPRLVAGQMGEHDAAIAVSRARRASL